VTIRLFDIEAQKTFEQEVETYDLRVKDRMDNPGASNEPWPAFPKQPEPTVDSRDKGLTKPGNNFATPIGGNDFRGGAADPRSRDPLDFDGNSQSAVKGHESVWQFNANDGELESSDASPFKIKR
jgi:hypothetical protein